MKKIKIKPKTTKALGIDITSRSISLVCLKQDKQGIQIVHAARQSVPDGLFQNGQLENSKKLKQILRALRRKCRQVRRATLSLYSSRSLVQILDVPTTISMTMGQYVQKEIKQYVTLAGVKTVSDYRTLETTESLKRVLVAAGDVKCISGAVNACQDAGLDVTKVEPSVLAYVRALYHKKEANQFGRNIVLAAFQDETVCLAVLRGGELDFIATHSVAEFEGDSERVALFLEKKIKMILQYYAVEMPESGDLWKIEVVTEHGFDFSDMAQTRLSEGMGKTPVEVITPHKFESHGSIRVAENISPDQISIAAIGYAMESLDSEVVLPDINLLPGQIRAVKDVRKNLLLTAIMAATCLLVTALASLGIVLKANDMNDRISEKRPQSAVSNVVRVRGAVESEIEQVGKIPTMLKERLASQKSVNLAAILSDISHNRPKGVCLTSVATKENDVIILKGQALTYGDVTSYVTRLGQSVQIEMASLMKTDHKVGFNSHHVYEIKCELKSKTGI